MKNLFTHPAYRAAVDADHAYGETIRRITNGKRDRWTLTADDKCHPDYRPAYNRMVSTGKVWSKVVQENIRFAS